MKNTETLIFELDQKILVKEDEAIKIDHQIEMARAEYFENKKRYSPTWMAGAKHAAKCRRLEVARLKQERGALVRDLGEENRKISDDRNEKEFIPVLRRLLLEKYSEASIKKIFTKAGKIVDGAKP
jgi:hypothetical protein